LGTFIPPAATIALHQQAMTAALADTFQIRPVTTLESTVAFAHFSSRANGLGSETMVQTPDEVFGNFYNDQNRRASTVQLSEVFSTVHQGRLGQHLLKAGFDALYTDYAETNTNRPIEVRRADGTLAETITFDPTTERHSRTSHAAAFVQDWWQVHSRLLIEAGVRLEYNDAFGTGTVAPRAAATLALKADGSAALRGRHRRVPRSRPVGHRHVRPARPSDGDSLRLRRRHAHRTVRDLCSHPRARSAGAAQPDLECGI
jgi:outer membrane receptor protein involved in Fe transport